MTGGQEPMFFQTLRGTVMHVRAPGDAWARLCSLKTTRPSEVFKDVIELGNFEKARTQGRQFCTTCLSRAGLTL